MKMIMIICPQSREEEVYTLIARHDVHAYSAIHDVTGAGQSGRKMGTHVWPGKSILMFAVVDDSKSTELAAALKECEENLFPGEGMRAFIMTIDSMI